MAHQDEQSDPDRSGLNGTGQTDSFERAVLQTVAYADIFDYPLTARELHRYLHGWRATPAELDALLRRSERLATALSQVGPYLTLVGRETITERRAERSRVAARLWPEARHYGALIARLPFVRMVAVTGALAVDNVDSDADIDFLVVTKPGHLWSCRALIIALVRAAARRGIALCPNYFVAADALEFPERSLYTARELSQMVPLAGFETYRRLRALNPWTQEYFPNAIGAPSGTQRDEPRRPRAVTLLEWAAHNPVGARIERWEMGRKIQKFSRLRPDHAEAAFSAARCKGHFDAHARRVMGEYQERTTTLERQTAPVAGRPGRVVEP